MYAISYERLSEIVRVHLLCNVEQLSELSIFKHSYFQDWMNLDLKEKYIVSIGFKQHQKCQIGQCRQSYTVEFDPFAPAECDV